MFYKLRQTFINFIFYTKRAASPFFNDEAYRQIRFRLFWLILLSFQILFSIKILEILNQKTQTYFFNRQQRLILEQNIEQTEKDIVRINSSPQTVEKILGSLPTAKDNYDLLNSLNSAASNNQIRLLRINFLPTQKSNFTGLLEQRVNIELQGKFENIFNFFEAVKENLRPIYTKSLNLSTQSNKLVGDYISVDALLITYLTESN